MKALVFVLVLANLLFFAFDKGYFGRPDNPDAGRVERQIHPERIRVVARDEPPPAKPAEPKEETPAVPREEVREGVKEGVKAEGGAAVCVAWGGLSAVTEESLSGLLAEKFADFKLERRTAAVEGGNWWVFIPPLASRAEAERKARELKRMGVSDYFIIQEAGPNRHAVSLGVFSSEAGAGEHFAYLKKKGVRSARLAPRNALLTVEARGPDARHSALLAAVAAALPEARTQDCQ